MCSHLVKDTNPLLSGQKGCVNYAPKVKKLTNTKLKNCLPGVFSFDPESKIEKVPCILQSDPTLLHFSAKLPTSLLCLVYLSPFGLQSLCSN